VFKILSGSDRLEKLWGHIGNMDPDEIREHIRKVRADRRLTKTRITVKKKTKVGSDAARTKMKSLLDGMSEADKERLLKELEGG